MRIICCGNRDRGDDAAGLLVYDRLREIGIDAELCVAQPLELVETWTGADDVIVVDAVVTGAAPGTIHEWDGNAAHFPAIRSTSTHGFGIAEAIQLARRIGQLPKNLHVYGIEARQFDAGSEPSLAVREAAERLAQQLAAAFPECKQSTIGESKSAGTITGRVVTAAPGCPAERKLG